MPGPHSSGWATPTDGVGNKIWGAGSGSPPPSSGSILVAAVITQGNAAAGGPTDQSAHAWTLDAYSGDFSNGAQFPGPGTDCTLSVYHRAIVPGETGVAAGVWTAHAAQVVGAWIDELSGIDPATIALVTHGNDTVNPAAGGAAEVNGTSTGVLWVVQALQKVNYGQVSQLTPVNGITTRQANMNNQDLAAGVCGATTDPYPPDIFFSHRVVVGATTVGGSVSCTGAIPDYNLMGRARAAYSIDAPGSFAISQSAWGAGLVSGGTATVNLPSAP